MVEGVCREVLRCIGVGVVGYVLKKLLARWGSLLAKGVWFWDKSRECGNGGQ